MIDFINDDRVAGKPRDNQPHNPTIRDQHDAPIIEEVKKPEDNRFCSKNVCSIVWYGSIAIGSGIIVALVFNLLSKHSSRYS